MTLSDLGNIGELIGAIAVLVTLAYLAMQIRQSSAATRAQIRQSLAESQIQYIQSRATDPFLREVMNKVWSGQSLEGVDSFGLRAHILAHLRLMENYFAQYNIGTMDREDWRAMREIIKRQLRLPVYRQCFLDLQGGWNAGFSAEIERILLENDESAPE